MPPLGACLGGEAPLAEHHGWFGAIHPLEICVETSEGAVAAGQGDGGHGVARFGME